MKGTKAMTAAERSRKHRERVRADGGRLIHVALDASDVARLEAIMVRRDTNVTGAISYALEHVLG